MMQTMMPPRGPYVKAVMQPHGGFSFSDSRDGGLVAHATALEGTELSERRLQARCLTRR